MYKVIKKIEKLDPYFEVCKAGIICKTGILIEERVGTGDIVFEEWHLITETEKIIFDCNPAYAPLVIDDKVFTGSSRDRNNNIVFNLKGEVLFKKNSSEAIVFHKISGDQTGIEKQYLLQMSKPNDLKEYGLIDKERNVVLPLNHRVSWGIVHMLDDLFIVGMDLKSFTTYHFPSKTRLWDCDISHFGDYRDGIWKTEVRLSHILGLYNEFIYVLLTNNVCIEVHKQTGKITCQWENMDSCLLDKKRGRILGFKIDYRDHETKCTRRVVNLNSKEVYVADVSQKISKRNINRLIINKGTTVQGDHFICIFESINSPEDWKYGYMTGLISYNLKTDEIDWQYLLQEGMFAGNPLIVDDKIYVMNGGLRELWVFQKES